MPNLKRVGRQLREEREQSQARLTQLDSALKALGDVATYGSSSKRGRVMAGVGNPCQRLPASGLRPAQSARRVKWKASQKKK